MEKSVKFDKDFKKNFKIEGWMHPTTITSVIDGRKYAVCGGTWIHIPNDMTFDEVQLGWIDLKPTLKQNDIFKEVKSSKGNTTYKVSFRSGSWNCTCSGFGFRRKCSHVEGIKEDLKKLF